MKGVFGVLVSLALIAAGLAAASAYREELLEFLSFDSFSELPRPQPISFQSVPAVSEGGSRQVIAPPPLQAGSETEGTLTKSGVLLWTNIHRGSAGLAPLAQEDRLEQAAQIKLQDMFARQYFAHSAPDGSMGAGELADSAGYEYIVVGENLALGNFGSDQALVQAWMDSPGHRANILHEQYTEIGIAAGRGTYEGRATWMAVQIFGMPRAACPEPDDGLQAEIAHQREALEELAPVLETKREELENTRPRRGAAYNQKVQEYNALVEQYNALVAETKALISQYNAQVNAFNSCAGLP